MKSIHTIMKRLYPDSGPGAALLIIKEGKVMIEEGYGLADLETKSLVSPSTNFRLASVSKQFTAMCIMLLVERHKLLLRDSLGSLFSDIPTAIREITIMQLLTHTSGIWDYEKLIPEEQRIQLSDWDVLQLIRQKDKVYFTPGSKFRYSNAGYCLLSLIVEKAGGLVFNEFVRKNIFVPLEMEYSSVYQRDEEISQRAYGYHLENGQWHFADQGISSATLGDGGIYTSLRDYRKWNDALSSRQLISTGGVKNIFIPQAVVKDGVSYGGGWFLGKETDGTNCMFHSGESTGFRNMVYRNPDKGLLIAIFVNRDDDAIAKVFESITNLMGIHLAVTHSEEEIFSLFHWLSHVYDG